MEYNLPEKFIKKLQWFPESGMGYHLVDVELKDGRILSKLTVLNSSILVFDGFLEIGEIKGIKVLG